MENGEGLVDPFWVVPDEFAVVFPVVVTVWVVAVLMGLCLLK
jgi:hypothetical protein